MTLNPVPSNNIRNYVLKWNEVKTRQNLAPGSKLNRIFILYDYTAKFILYAHTVKFTLFDYTVQFILYGYTVQFILYYYTVKLGNYKEHMKKKSNNT